MIEEESTSNRNYASKKIIPSNETKTNKKKPMK